MREYLKDFRKRAGATQQNVASELNITQQYYNQLELGKRKISVPIICGLAKIFCTETQNIVEQENDYLSNQQREEEK